MVSLLPFALPSSASPSSPLYPSFWLLFSHTPLLPILSLPLLTPPNPLCYLPLSDFLYTSLLPRVCVRVVSVKWKAFWSRHSGILRQPKPCFAILSVPVRSVLPSKKGDTAHSYVPYVQQKPSYMYSQVFHNGTFLAAKWPPIGSWCNQYLQGYILVAMVTINFLFFVAYQAAGWLTSCDCILSGWRRADRTTSCCQNGWVGNIWWMGLLIYMSLVTWADDPTSVFCSSTLLWLMWLLRNEKANNGHFTPHSGDIIYCSDIIRGQRSSIVYSVYFFFNC